MTDETARRPDAPSWLDVMEDVLDESIEGEDEISASLSEFAVDVPTSLGEESTHYRWEFDGAVTVRTKGVRATLAEWLRYWDGRDD
ncbi:hypothetical protein [Halomarina oriensis]|uniref:Uncharacterized protein n=1 Tax=Halomarina oriensis TaxID=671145 RepID=A0A6B0GLQ3_9EURY|nr:hypothetical protein [Halomarina oriensis]MWG33055.1 hypothetical protein [Halomarina oriensis]